MPAELYFSNSAGLLLDQLAATLGAGDPFEAPRIATPTPALRRMVQMGLAERWGAAAHLDFLLLEGSLWDCLARLDAYHFASDREPARLLDAKGLQGLLLAQLLAEPPEAAAHYLDGDKAQAVLGPQHSRKLLQLSARLALLFREYEYSRVQEHGREGVASLWLKGKTCFEGYLGADAPPATRERVRQLEAWQGELYRRVFGAGGLRDQVGEKTGQYLYTLPQYREMVFAQARKDAGNDPDGEGGGDAATLPILHLFGLPHVSPFHRSLIQQLADAEATGGRPTLFRIFALNPCAEYWEDSADPRTRRRRLQQDLLRQEKFTGWRSLTVEEKRGLKLKREALWAESLAELDEDNTLLARWGMVGRETVQLWCQVTDYAFAGRFREPQKDTLLATLQGAVLQRRGALPPEERRPQDSSLKLFTAPERHLEIEALQADLWRRFTEDSTLRPDDVAIALIDPETYGPVIDMVLGARQAGERGHIPHARPEAGTQSSDPYWRGLSTLMRAAEGAWDRQALLALLENPRCQAKMDISPGEAEALAQAVVDMNLYQGGPGRKEGGRPDPHRFATGALRALLARWMEPPGTSEATSFAGYLPFEVDGLDEEALARWVQWLQGIEDALAPFLVGAREVESASGRSLGAWAEAFAILAERTLAPSEEAPGELRLLRNLKALRRHWEWLDQVQPRPYSRFFFLEGLRQALAKAEVSGPPWLSGGVQVGSLESLRGVPFRILYVPGLQEGDFPDESLQNSLDLRQFRRVIGDLEPASRNRYALLMAMMQATDAVVLSYVDHDLERNQALQPSSVLGECLDTLERDVLAPDSPGKRACFRSVAMTSEHPAPRAAARSPEAEPGIRPGPEEAAKEIAPPSRIDLDALAFFLKDPSGQLWRWEQGLSRRHDAEPEAHEPFTLGMKAMRRLTWQVLADLACRALPTSDLDATQGFVKHLEAWRLRGRLPPGRYGDIAAEKALADLGIWWQVLCGDMTLEWGDAGPRALHGIRIGEAWPAEPRLPRIDCAARTYAGHALCGYQGFAWKKRGGGYALLTSSVQAKDWPALIPAFVFSAFALVGEDAFAEHFAAAPLEVHARPHAGEKGSRRVFRIHLDREGAMSWLDAVWRHLPRKKNTDLPPALIDWVEALPSVANAYPWHQGTAEAEAFRKRVGQRRDARLADPQPGLSPLDTVMALMPARPCSDPLAWARDVFAPMLAAIERPPERGKSRSPDASQEDDEGDEDDSTESGDET